MPLVIQTDPKYERYLKKHLEKEHSKTKGKMKLIKKKFIQQHERMLKMAKLRALSDVSLERELTDEEFEEMKKLGKELL
jgi:hypothetical protein